MSGFAGHHRHHLNRWKGHPHREVASTEVMCRRTTRLLCMGRRRKNGSAFSLFAQDLF